MSIGRRLRAEGYGDESTSLALIRTQLHFATLHYRREGPFLIFPLPSFSSSHGSRATQPPLRRLYSGSSLRYDLPGASLCATRASTPLRKGENAFSTPMKSKHPTRRGTLEHVAYFANRKQPRFIEARRCELPIRLGTRSWPNVPTRGNHCFHYKDYS